MRMVSRKHWVGRDGWIAEWGPKGSKRLVHSAILFFVGCFGGVM